MAYSYQMAIQMAYKAVLQTAQYGLPEDSTEQNAVLDRVCSVFAQFACDGAGITGKFAKLPLGVNGSYGQGTIYVSWSLTDTDALPEFISTLCHELCHFWQDVCFHDWYVEQLKKYVKASADFDQYEKQPVEVQARDFSRVVLSMLNITNDEEEK